MLKSGVYQWLNMVTGKVYIGSSINVLKRAYHHQWALRRGTHPNEKWQRAWTKYGEAAFELSVLEECEKALLLAAEQTWIDRKHAVKCGYNILPIAGSSLGRKLSEKTKALIGAKSRERNQGTNHPMYGRKHAVETLELMSANRRGKPNLKLRGRLFSADARAKLRKAAAARGLDGARNPFFGRKHSDETRAKMRVAWEHRRAATLGREA